MVHNHPMNFSDKSSIKVDSMISKNWSSWILKIAILLQHVDLLMVDVILLHLGSLGNKLFSEN